MDHFEDEQIVCAECGSSFLFSGGEAAFYAQRNLAFPPKRCKVCRAARKPQGADQRGGGGGFQQQRGGFDQPRGGGFQQRSGGFDQPRGAAPQRSGGFDQPRGAAPQRSGGFQPRNDGPAPSFHNQGGAPVRRAPQQGGFERPRAPRYTGAVDEYRSPMQDNSTYLAAPAWGRNAPTQVQRSAPRPARVDDGNYRAPSFRDDAPRGGFAPRGAPGQDARSGTGNPRATGPSFSIQCNTCGVNAQVPFRPIEGRDVFCQACYRARKPIRHDMD